MLPGRTSTHEMKVHGATHSEAVARCAGTRAGLRAAMRWGGVLVLMAALMACGDDKGNNPQDNPQPDAGEPDAEDMNNDTPDVDDDSPDADDPPPPLPGAERGTFELSTGIVVEVEDSVRLLDGQRPLVTLAQNPVRALSYQETANGPLGIWAFSRRDESRRVYDIERRAQAEPNGGDAAEVRWRGPDGAVALMTVAPGPTEDSTRVSVALDGDEFQSIEVAFSCDNGASFAGFGEQYNAIEQRGGAFDLFVSEQGIGREGGRLIQGDEHTTYFPMPWWMDLEQNFGVLFETDHRVLVDLCSADGGEARIEVTGGLPASFLVFKGPSTFDLIEQLSQVVGRPKKPPVWAFEEPWISAQGGSAAVRAFIEELDANEVPYGAIWSQDWTGVRTNFDGGLGVQYRWEGDVEHYPDLDALIEELHDNGKRFLGYANPFIDPNLPNHFEDMANDGLLILDPEGAPYVFGAPNGQSSHPDFTRQETQDYVVDALVAMVVDRGIDGWMADFAEWNPLDAVQADGSDPAAIHNLFPVQWHQANRIAMDQARPDGDWVTIARSGWTGVQAYSMIHWVGDQEADWSESDGLPTVVPAMLNLGFAGVPYVTHDIGGFSGGPSTKELYMRWTELGAFTPVMRTHEGNRRQENHNWNTDEETIAHFRRFARIHQALLPEWQALADEAEATSAPMVRALVLHYPDDPQARTISDQFMLGQSLLIAPVVEEGATEREVYLPEGQWFHVFTGESFQGPMTMTVEAPIGTPPVFSKDVDREDLRAIE